MRLYYLKNKAEFYKGLQRLFSDLNIPVNYLDDKPLSPDVILAKTYKGNNEAHQLMDDVFILGMVDDAAFKGEKSTEVKKITTDYDGIIIFGVTLINRYKNLLPTRSQLAEITRAFNQEFYFTPVIVVFKYEHHIAFGNTERLKYKQGWREGEKVGKISLLMNIDIYDTHRGHISILKQLRIETTGRNAITNFTQLYYYYQSVFSISVLNKSFYGEIITWFNKAINDITIPGQKEASEKHHDFTVRLIARLIFIWFLKELKVVKEELLVPMFNNGTINNLIKPKDNGTAYYKFILQNLFFNALNSEPNEREIINFEIYTSSYSDIDKLIELIFYSPYLNGGLFDIHPNDWYESGKINNTFKVPDHLFLDIQTGLNSILSRYKFTIAENTPLEEEIAVDPEMLGRIFENLLAEQSDDTKEAARKNAGAFYTPRPVVAYMCRTSLMEHLGVAIELKNGKDIIQKLLKTIVLDPACGSGAFPMGMLEEMMQILDKIDPDGNLWVAEMLKTKDQDFQEHISDFIADKQIRYVKKLGLLRNCLFGIDILEYAVEITKLRCWLSLIVEQKVDFSKPNYNLKPLPNLDFKFYKKNSLFRYYKDKNLNQLIVPFDKEKLLDNLVDLENDYFIAKSSKHGNKEEIKSKIINLLENVVNAQSDQKQKELNASLRYLNSLKANKASLKEISKEKKKYDKLAKELSDLVIFKDSIKDYFIEKVVFPGIFSEKLNNPGFDIIIGNPPYVNNKQISSMGLSQKLECEYGFCDDLYNHFTIRGLELVKKGGLLCYITSDTFLTLQTKKNLRMTFLGINNLFTDSNIPLPESHVLEIINTPKAFAALVDTAIFIVKKEKIKENTNLVYVDLRKPNAASFEISKDEWNQIKTSKENLSGWERILEHTFKTLGDRDSKWDLSHTCDGVNVLKDKASSLLKFKLPVTPYLNSINYAIFSPTPYNCQLLERIIKPARPVYNHWWENIETSRKIENNRDKIKEYMNNLKPGMISLIGLLTDGGQGLATGNNGLFVGYNESSRFAKRCKETRIIKLFEVIQKYPAIKFEWPLLKNVNSITELGVTFDRLKEPDIWKIFDGIKNKYGLRVFGKGYIYRVIPADLQFNVDNITEKQMQKGIASKKCWVPYDKGDREGNRWYSKTTYLIDWSIESVSILSTDEKARWQGYNFFFRNGFCWTNVLNPNSVYFKSRIKEKTVNDVGTMSLYDEKGFGSEYFVSSLNSYLHFKMLREFFNGTVNVQMNDIRKLPIIIPTKTQLNKIISAFEKCIKIKRNYFKGEIDSKVSKQLLIPLEEEIDHIVNSLYGITLTETNEIEDLYIDEVDVFDEHDEELEEAL